jgi:hypothetical protein
MTESQHDERRVIDLVSAKKEAYQAGFEKFHLALADEGVNELTEKEREDLSINLDMFTGSAEYANIILPRLRSLAGYTDTGGHGTFTTLEGTVKVVDPREYAGQQPEIQEGAAQELVPHVLDILVGKFFQGAWDGAVLDTEVN